MKWFGRLSFIVIMALFSGQIFAQQNPAVGFIEAQAWRVEVLNIYPHDANAYTQGLIWRDGFLYESTGQRGESTLREVNPQTGDVLRLVDVNRPSEQMTGDNALPNYFAEGLELVGDNLIQLTWTAGEALVYDFETFEHIDTLTYNSDGWGICYDGRYIYMSDSSQYLAIREADTFELIGRMLVTVNGQPLQAQLLNELECVGDTIYANLWRTDFIVSIDKFTGNVIAVIDAGGLLTDEMRLEISGATRNEDSTINVPSSAVLNGIAYNPETDTFFITGKDWPRMFEVNFVPSQ